MGSAAAATTTLLARATPAGAGTPASVKVTRQRRRVVIIGSGFGGAVSALRLTQAGVPVTMLERGKRWVTGPNAETFPHASSPDERALFYSSAPTLFGKPVSLSPYAGLLDAVIGDNMLVMCAAGYGGGSLVYQGMTLEPARNVFEREFPAQINYDEMHTQHYRTVASMLQIATAPDALVNSPTYAAPRLFATKARAAGYAVEKIPMPIDWSYALRELKGQMKPSYTNGDCALGVNNGGKHTLDVTYLAQAEATGRLEVNLLHRVTDIVRTKAGEWEVHVARTDLYGTTLENKIITTPALIMGAGSTGTTRMLVRAGATGQITDLPDDLGSNWGTNADRILVWTDLVDDFGAVQGGPVVYGSKDWGNAATANTVIQASFPPLSLAGMGINTRSTTMVGYGVSDARGRFTYDARRDDATLHWKHEGDSYIQTTKIGPRTKAIAGFGSILLDTNAAVPSTWHPVGGAGMGTVCDYEGRVHGQRGLYVLDGALLPGSAAACNPSMTIAAIAERAMSRIVRTDVGSVI